MLNNIVVIIVNYNAKHYLTECVKSVFVNDNNVSIIVVDNCSHDNSIELLERSFPNQTNLKIIKNKKNVGFSVANNIGINASKEKYILLLNPDCIIAADTLQKMSEVMESHPEVGMAGCLIKNLDQTVQATSIRTIPTPWNSLVRVLHLNKFINKKEFRGLDVANKDLPTKVSEVEAISGAFMFIRRQALQRVGLLDEDYFLYCEDIDWMVRFKQHGWKILFVPFTEIMHIKSFSSKQVPFRVLWYKHRGMIRFYRKFFLQQYSRWVAVLVFMGIALRFFILIILEAGKQLLQLRKRGGDNPIRNNFIC